MKPILAAAAAALIALTGTAALAQSGRDDHRDNRGDNQQRDNRGDDHHYVQHNDWKRGHRLAQEDWSRGQQVDWRAHHLRHPQRGYEWREVDGNYVLAAAATGLIASIIANNH